MTDTPGTRVERRRTTRIAPKGAIIVHVHGHAQQGRLANLGLGGLFAVTPVSAPDRWLGRPVEVEIRLDGQHAEWLRATGQVIRIDAAGLAVSFDEPVPPALLAMIDHVTTASRASNRVLSVVLIDGDAERRSAMAEGFSAAGCSVVAVATPLEAIVRLGESHFEPDVVAVSDSHDAADMRAFVERYHANAKLVTIGHELSAPDNIAHWLSSADPDSDLTRRVRDVLVAHRRLR